MGTASDTSVSQSA